MHDEVRRRLAQIAADTVTGAIWNPKLHPRARDGKFIEVGGWVRGLFRIGMIEQELNGKVVDIKPSQSSQGPLILVETKHGNLPIRADQVRQAVKPKGFLQKILTKGEDLAKYQASMSDLSGDVTFASGMPLVGKEINGVPLSEIPNFDPRSIPDKDVGEPPLPTASKKKQSTGVLIQEPDGRVWFYEPSNHFGGYRATFSKGRVEDEDTLQQAALREAYEELGLVAEITDYVGDYEGSVTMTRMYKGRRIGGAPWVHDYEVAEVRLAAPETAARDMNQERDHQILSDLTGDPTIIEEWRRTHPKPPPRLKSVVPKDIKDKISKGKVRTGDVKLAARALAYGIPVELKEIHQVSTLLDQLHANVQEAVALGQDAPFYDLCQVSVPDTNLFCADNAGIPRVQMPQLRGVPVPGSLADSLPKINGKVDLSAQFRSYLISQGVTITDDEILASHMKATQNELDGKMVARLTAGLRASDTTIPLTRTFVSRDDYIVDGHHRWAATVGLDAEDDALDELTLPVARINMPIADLIEAANQFAAEMGIPPKGVGPADTAAPAAPAAPAVV